MKIYVCIKQIPDPNTVVSKLDPSTKRLKQHPLVRNEKAKLLQKQRWQCPHCGLYFKEGDVLETDHDIPIALGGEGISDKYVYHRHCHDEKTARDMVLIAKHRAAGVNHN